MGLAIGGGLGDLYEKTELVQSVPSESYFQENVSEFLEFLNMINV